MPHIHVETSIHADPRTCFDLMRDVESHIRSTKTGERAVAGKTHGLLESGDQVTWEAKHFGLRLRMTVRVTRCDPPYLFEDEQVRGPFGSLHHRHAFRAHETGTLMVDDFDFRSPLGPLGALADLLLVGSHMRRFLMERAAALKAMAEGPGAPSGALG